MNLEMPSPAEADSLRTILLIVLGVMILTIPVVCVIVVAKVNAQRKQRPQLNRGTDRARHDTGGYDPMTVAGASLHAPHSPSYQDETPHRRHEDDQAMKPDDTMPASDGESSWFNNSGSSSESGSSFSDSSGGGGDSGGGGGGGGGSSE